TPRSATLESHSASKVYDGKPLKCEIFGWNGRDLVAGQFPGGTFTGQQTEVGSSDNLFTARIIEEKTGRDVTHNYTITYRYGTLTVQPGVVHEVEKEGDEASIDYTSAEDDAADGDGIVVARYVLYGITEATPLFLREKSYGNYTGSTWQAAEPCELSTRYSPLYFAGTTAKGCSGTNLFEITIEKKGSTMVPYFIDYSNGQKVGFSGTDVHLSLDRNSYETYVHVLSDRHSIEELMAVSSSQKDAWVRNSEPAYRAYVHKTYLDIPESTKEAMLEIAAQNGIKAGSATLIFDIQEYIRSAAKYNLHGKPYPQGVDVAVYFLRVAKEGLCRHFASAATLMYRAFGIPARYTVGYSTTAQPSDNPIDVWADQGHAWVEIYVDGIGWIPLEVTAGIEGEADGSGNLMTPDGKIMIDITTYSAEKYYDSHPFEAWTGDKYWISKGNLRPGDKLIATVQEGKPDMVEIDVSANLLKEWKIVDASGKDVSDMYHVTEKIGTSEIVQRPLTVSSASATKIYDGTPLAALNYWISAGSLAPNHQLKVTVTGTITKVGSTKNTMSVSIVDKDTGNSVMGYYDITMDTGTLQILP
ncbi:MAG: hypothetical protein IKV00_10190, partial [Clostridia bacterium]|nr:hypothetical protein [Clostridia bacterium]